MLQASRVAPGMVVRVNGLAMVGRARCLSSDSWRPVGCTSRKGLPQHHHQRTTPILAAALTNRRQHLLPEQSLPSFLRGAAWFSTDSSSSSSSSSSTGTSSSGPSAPPIFTPERRRGRASTDEPDVLHDGPVELMHKTSSNQALVRDADGNVIVASAGVDEAYEMAGGGAEESGESEEETAARRAMVQKRAHDMDEERDDWTRHAQSEVLEQMEQLEHGDHQKKKEGGVAEDARLEQYLRGAEPAIQSPIFPGDSHAHPAIEETATNHHHHQQQQQHVSPHPGGDTRIERGGSRLLPKDMPDLEAQLATAGYGSMSPRESGRAFGEPFWEGGGKPKVAMEELGQQCLGSSQPDTRHHKLQEGHVDKRKPIVRPDAPQQQQSGEAEEQEEGQGGGNGGRGARRVDVKAAVVEATAQAVKETTEGVAATVVSVSEGVSAAVDLAKDAVTKGSSQANPAHNPDQMGKLKQVVGGVKQVADKTGLPTGVSSSSTSPPTTAARRYRPADESWSP